LKLNEEVTPSKETRSSTIYSKILTNKGPFATVRSTQRSFSSKCRPSSNDVIAIFKALAEDEIGALKQIDSLSIFYKKIPHIVTEEKLSAYNVGDHTYASAFREMCALTLMSKEQFNKCLENSPDKAELSDVYCILPYTFHVFLLLLL